MWSCSCLVQSISMKTRGEKFLIKQSALRGLVCAVSWHSLWVFLQTCKLWKKMKKKKYFSWRWFCGEWIKRKIIIKKVLPFLRFWWLLLRASIVYVFNLKYLHSYFQTGKMKIVINWKFYDAGRICNKTKWIKWNRRICLFTAVNSFCNSFLFVIVDSWFL